jgi:hypothetical protein
MATSIEGIFRDGKVELLGPVPEGVSESPTVSVPVDLATRGIDAQQAAHLRARLIAFAEDWERPETDVYDKA